MATIHYGTSISGEDDELIAVPVDTIIVTPETAFAEIELGDGMFIMMYAMTDSQGHVAYSATATFESKDGEITTSVTPTSQAVPAATPAPATAAATNYAKFTDGNSYVVSQKGQYIVKIDPAFSGYEVVYEESPEIGRIISEPVYLGNSLFFETWYYDTSTSNIWRLDLSTGQKTAIVKNKNSTELDRWRVLSNNKIIYRSWNAQDTVDVWMCNLDGSNLKKNIGKRQTHRPQHGGIQRQNLYDRWRRRRVDL